MRAWLSLWGRRAFGIFLCIGSWLIAMGLFSLGEGWFEDTVGLHDLHDLFLHGVVRILGAKGGAVFFFLAGILVLWAFLIKDPASVDEDRD